jgi:hypothetical protein
LVDCRDYFLAQARMCGSNQKAPHHPLRHARRFVWPERHSTQRIRKFFSKRTGFLVVKRVLACNDLAGAEESMGDTPTQRELRSEFDRILAAHERRARLITQLHRQAIATANDLSPRQKTIEAGIAKDPRRRKTEAWLIAAGAIFVALGCLLAVLG